ncbi:DUF4153 domain-containing protein [Aurantimonas endophytica]|uniref:DUF4153 domain-containing protein n=1 Tax=Aurantimonas endophytica TaxID=1522175 RepID=A0A7W6MNB8_9HYPH|nr:DUF4153 domain-containing protein [Aurantimonas endophytica]MBB4001728.1 hypothetical protein [Aurantimonas endophytica]MCO6402635.1 DUF4153 domain-containing protein [Aurantimonas endophytica]
MASRIFEAGSVRFRRVTAGLARGAGTAAARFPVTTLLIVAISLLSNLAVRDYFLPNEADLPWLLASLYGGAASAVVVTLASEARGLASLIRHGSALAAALAVGLAIWFGPRFGVYPPALIAAVTLAVPLAPFIRRGDGMRFWTYTLWTNVGVVLAFLSVLLFTLGLSAILEMIRFLFAVGLSNTAYEHIFVTAFTLIGPLFALGRVPAGFEEAMPGPEDRLVAGVRIMVGWIAAPLALVTALVLHLYAVKILATASLPANEIGWIVTFFALLVLALRIAIAPFLAEETLPIRLFRRSFVAILVVPLVLLAIAATIRIAAEGVTLPRYYLALGVLAAGVVVLMQAVKRLRGDIRVMASVPLLLLALSSFGPWGAASTVGRSQTALIVAEADATGAEGDATLVAADRGGNADRRLRSRLYALEDAGQIHRVLPYLDPALRERVAEAQGRDNSAFDILMAGLGLSRPSTLQAVRSFTAGSTLVVDTDGYDRATTELSVAAGEVDENAPDARSPIPVAARIEGNQLVVRVGTAEDQFDLTAAIADLPEAVFATPPERLAPPVLDLQGVGGRRLRLVLRQVIQEGDGGAISAATMSLHFRASEWDPA